MAHRASPSTTGLGLLALLAGCVPAGALETGRVMRQGETELVVGVGYAWQPVPRQRLARDTVVHSRAHPVFPHQVTLFFRPLHGIGADSEIDGTLAILMAPFVVGFVALAGVKHSFAPDAEHLSAAAGARAGTEVTLFAGGPDGSSEAAFVAELRMVGAAHFSEESAVYLVPSLLYERRRYDGQGVIGVTPCNIWSLGAALGWQQRLSVEEPKTLYLEGATLFTPATDGWRWSGFGGLQRPVRDDG